MRKDSPRAAELGRLLAEEMEDHREIVHAQAPERVLVAADRSQVLTVAVDVEDLAELACVDELLQLGHAGVVEEQVAGHEDAPFGSGQLGELVRLPAGERHRLLHQDVLLHLQRSLREPCMSGHGRRDDDRVDLGILEDVLEAVGERRRGKASSQRVDPRRIEVAEPLQAGELVEVPGEVAAPRAEPDLRDYSFHTLPFAEPAVPVALRRSTTRRASAASAS